MRAIYALVVDPPGTVHLGKYEIQCSRECIARAIEMARREEAEHTEAMRKAREDPKREPHPFAQVSWTVRVTSNAEIERREQERATLQFLRGGKG